ncbi:copper resistance protein [Corynebacterium sp. sy017]|uniref:cytochrome c oxidase assembly protein n=1 Tax=unclassified Corynebacterium TaxID=2624378 RepID=UPI001186DD39|nr:MULTISPECIES: cytochrome c oxidase assembly protein [unclassified Corynebacterium]MBP3088203.1 copper resistance protein [Corynebacterium sp. sy017]QDZ43132.1 copper resistance protein [Corynebacterium sp. sy039]TSD92705.1 copper resistance protein [Corynebacterium sp. SY003]
MSDSSTSVRSAKPVYLIFIVIAGVVAATLGWVFLGESLAELGIPDPGILTTMGYPFLRAVAWTLVSLSVGSFLASAFFIMPIDSRLSVDGLISTRTGAAAALLYACVALLMIPMTLSDTSGQPFFQSLELSAWGDALELIAAAKAWLVSSIIAFVVGVIAVFSRKWSAQPLLLVGAFAIVLPLGLEGHSASGGNHDYGTNSLLWHLFFALLWVGGLLGLIAHARRLGPGLSIAVRRFSMLAFVSMLAMIASGVINAAVRMRLEDLFTTSYGQAIVAKIILTLLLAFFGLIHRKKTIPQLDDRPKLFVRIAIAEVFIMAATIGVAVSLGRTPPPPPLYTSLSKMMLEMGYEVTKAPTFWNIWSVWRFDIMFSTFGIIITLAYLWGLWKLKKQGKTWKWQRTFWFLLGSVGLSTVMSSGIGLYMPAMFSMHMVAHMVISMVIPVFLVLGAPLSLALEVTKKNPPEQPGLHEWIEAFCQSRILKFIMHPAFNTIQFITIFYLLYITPWYDLMVSEHAGHLLMNWVFLLSGYVYYWEMIGLDPKPRKNKVIIRIMWLLFSMPFHLYFGVYLMQLSLILAKDFYSELDLPFPVDLMHDQNVGGGIAWASGAFPLLVVFGALFIEWLQEDRKAEKEYEQRAAQDDDDELAQYNELLAQMNQRNRR